MDAVFDTARTFGWLEEARSLSELGPMPKLLDLALRDFEGHPQKFEWIVFREPSRQGFKTRTLSLRGFAAYNHGRFRSFPNAKCYAGQRPQQGCVGGVQDLAGQKVGTTPDFAANLGASYERPVWGNWATALALDGFYSSRYNHSAGGSNFRPDSIRAIGGMPGHQNDALIPNVKYRPIVSYMLLAVWKPMSVELPNIGGALSNRFETWKYTSGPPVTEAN